MTANEFALQEMRNLALETRAVQPELRGTLLSRIRTLRGLYPAQFQQLSAADRALIEVPAASASTSATIDLETWIGERTEGGHESAASP